VFIVNESRTVKNVHAHEDFGHTIDDFIYLNPEGILSDTFRKYIIDQKHTQDAISIAHFEFWRQSVNVIDALIKRNGNIQDISGLPIIVIKWFEMIKSICHDPEIIPKIVNFIFQSEAPLIYADTINYHSLVLLDPIQRYVANVNIQIDDILIIKNLTQTLFMSFRSGCMGFSDNIAYKLLEGVKLFALKYNHKYIHIEATPKWLSNLLIKYNAVNVEYKRNIHSRSVILTQIPIVKNGDIIIFDSNVRIVNNI